MILEAELHNYKDISLLIDAITNQQYKFRTGSSLEDNIFSI